MVIPNCRRCAQRPGDIIRMHNPALLSRVSPDSRKAVRLQLQIDRQMIALPRILLRKPLFPGLNSQQLLDMVSQFMRDNVSLGKLRRASAKLLQLFPETQVDINLLVLRAIERASRSLRRPTP